MKKLPKKALEEFVKACKRKFGKDLVSVVLFGSRVKGYAREDSDYDILLLVKNLPGLMERFKLLEGLEEKIWKKYKIKISTLLVEPEELFEPINPLLFGVLSGYKLLFGKREWFSHLKRAGSWITKLDPIYIEGEREWRIKELL